MGAKLFSNLRRTIVGCTSRGNLCLRLENSLASQANYEQSYFMNKAIFWHSQATLYVIFSIKSKAERANCRSIEALIWPLGKADLNARAEFLSRGVGTIDETRICPSVPVPVPVPKKIFSTVQDQYQYSPSTDGTSASTSTTYINQIWPRNLKFSREKSIFHAENSKILRNFEFLSLKLKFEEKNLTYFGTFHGCQFIYLIFTFFCFGTGTDWLSTCAISTSTESVH
jgi:hypothetical protein